MAKMKFLDKVEVANDTKKYSQNSIFKGMQGTIIDAEIRDNCFNVIFVDERLHNKQFMSEESNFLSLEEDIIYPIKIKDLKLLKDNNCKDEDILESIPKNNPKWWCKVEDGFIKNLLGEKKNKIPYDFDS